MWALIGLFVGVAAGHYFGGEWGAVLGGLAGFLVGAVASGNRSRAAYRKPAGGQSWTPIAPAMRADAGLPAERALRERVAALEARVAALERGEAPAHGAAALQIGTAPPSPGESEATAPPREIAPAWRQAVDGTLQPESTAAVSATTDVQAAPLPASVEETAPAAQWATAGATAEATTGPAIADSQASPAPAYGVPPPNPLWAWFTGGNALTRIGVVVLFFGVAFLLRYLVEHYTIPIEWKLAGVAAVGIALIGIGLATAGSRPAYGRALEGAGAGILYLTAFAAFHLYHVLPATPSIALLVAISALTVGLAIRGDSQPLAALAVAGGFLAPMLVGEGGSPAPLFGWFAVLNAAIFALTWVRAWRALNVLGFVFTFVLGIAWGHQYYAPAHYAVVQPFLIVFFVFYVAIAIIYARRGPLVAKDPVDALLVFGVPLVGFALQAALVRDERYGAAWSALVLALVYGALFGALRKRTAPGFGLLARAFLALAVIFATIAVPLAFDERTTAALWAVEGAGVYWIGKEQRSLLARAFALAVELAAGIVFVVSGTGSDGDRLFANAFFSGALLIALSGLATAFFADRARDDLADVERGLVPLVFAWGIAWWLGAGGFEFTRQLPRGEAAHATLAWAAAGVALALALRRRMGWPRLAAAGIALLPTLAYAAFGDFERERTTLTTWGWLVFPVAWIVHWRVLRAAESLRFVDAASGAAAAAQGGAAGFLRVVHAVSAFALTAQVAWEASEWVGRYTPAHTVWVACAAALPAIVCVAATARLRLAARWPFADYGDAYAVGAGTPVAALLALWFVAVNLLAPGDAAPLPYAPLANPLDVTLALALAALFYWAVRASTMSERARYGFLGALLFMALNGLVLRTAHHWDDIPWRLSSLLSSKPLLAALTLTWTATALPLMFVATKRRLRPLWMVGAALLAVVVGKLFLVDLGALSGLPRVVAFLGVGALLLAIGWLSPLPPAARANAVKDG
ncbi:MAG: DUF2339 domain-containing protein [Betaproteobacteria bacterium]